MRIADVSAGGPSPIQSPIQSPVQQSPIQLQPTQAVFVGGGPNVVMHDHGNGMVSATSSMNSSSVPTMPTVGGGAGGPVQQNPVQQMPVQQSPVQQMPVQQIPVMYLPVVAMPVMQALGGPVQQLPVQQNPVQQIPVQQMPVQQMPVTSPPAGGVTGGATGAALISQLTTMVTTLTALVQQLSARVQQTPPANSKPPVPPATPPSSCPHGKGATPPASSLVARFTEEIKTKTTQDDQVATYKKYADQTADEAEKKRMFEIMIEPWSAERKDQLKRFLEAVSHQQG